MAAKTVSYRKGDTVKVRKESLECSISKIGMPDVYRGEEGVVIQVREFVQEDFQATIVLELDNGQVIATEQHHIRLLKRAPKE